MRDEAPPPQRHHEGGYLLGLGLGLGLGFGFGFGFGFGLANPPPPPPPTPPPKRDLYHTERDELHAEAGAREQAARRRVELSGRPGQGGKPG